MAAQRATQGGGDVTKGDATTSHRSEREQLMRRDIPLVFVGGRVQSDMVKWIDNLSRVKTFIDTKGECQE